MRLWYLSHKRPVKAQLSLRIRPVSPEPLLLTHMKNGSRQGVRPKLRHLAPLDSCTCMFEEWVYRGWKNHTLMRWLKWHNGFRPWSVWINILPFRQLDRGSYMSAVVLLNLLNEIGKTIRCKAVTGTRIQDSIYHKTLKWHFICKFCTKKSQLPH